MLLLQDTAWARFILCFRVAIDIMIATDPSIFLITQLYKLQEMSILDIWFTLLHLRSRALHKKLNVLRNKTILSHVSSWIKHSWFLVTIQQYGRIKFSPALSRLTLHFSPLEGHQTQNSASLCMLCFSCIALYVLVEQSCCCGRRESLCMFPECLM